MVSYLKNQIKIIIQKREKNPGSRLGFVCYIAQSIQQISTQIGLDWTGLDCYVAGKS